MFWTWPVVSLQAGNMSSLRLAGGSYINHGAHPVDASPGSADMVLLPRCHGLIGGQRPMATYTSTARADELWRRNLPVHPAAHSHAASSVCAWPSVSAPLPAALGAGPSRQAV